MRIGLAVAIVYLCSCAYAYWVVVSSSKSGHRPTWREIAATARREGPELVLLALGWLPILLYAAAHSIFRR